MKAENDHPLIIGGGIAGLSAGLHLAERGLKPLLLEANPDFIGGRMAGNEPVALEQAGKTWQFRGEHGMHGIWNNYVNLKAMLARHDLTPDLVPAIEENWLYKNGSQINNIPAGSAIRYSWVAAPLHYLMLFLRPRFLGMLGLGDWLSLFKVWFGLVYSLGVDPLADDEPLEGLWLSDMVNNWSPALRSFIVGLTRNGMAAPPEEIPLSGFIAFLRFYTLLRRDAWQFSYLPSDGGSGMTEPLRDKFLALGGRIEMGARVQEIFPTPDGWEIVWEDQATQSTRRINSPEVILATSSPAARQILSRSPTIGRQAKQMYFPRGMASAVVRVWYDRSPAKTAEAGMFSGDFVLDNYFWLDRIHDQYRAWHKETGGSCIEVHIYGPQEILREPDQVLLARAIADIQTIFTELRGHRLHQIIQRNEATHTLFGVGPANKHLGIETPWKNLFCAGDWVRHPAPAFFLERACLTGIEAANGVLKSRSLESFILQAYPKPEPFAGWIQKWMRKGIQNRRRRQKEK